MEENIKEVIKTLPFPIEPEKLKRKLKERYRNNKADLACIMWEFGDRPEGNIKGIASYFWTNWGWKKFFIPLGIKWRGFQWCLSGVKDEFINWVLDKQSWCETILKVKREFPRLVSNWKAREEIKNI
jgi:hypothetical protein